VLAGTAYRVLLEGLGFRSLELVIGQQPAVSKVTQRVEIVDVRACAALLELLERRDSLLILRVMFMHHLTANDQIAEHT
jgi:hypothetical protein